MEEQQQQVIWKLNLTSRSNLNALFGGPAGSYTQLTGHDRVYIIDRVQYLISSVEPGRNVIHLTPLQVGDVALSYSISGTTAHVSIWSDCEVHTELVSTVGVLGYPLSVVFKFIVQSAELFAK